MTDEYLDGIMNRNVADQSRTPRTEGGNWPTPEHAQHIQFEGCDCVVMSPEDYEALYESHRTLELEAADLRERLAKAEADARHVRQANENYRRENQIAVERLAKAREECAEHCLKGLIAEDSSQMRTRDSIKREAYNAAIHECAAAIRALSAPQSDSVVVPRETLERWALYIGQGDIYPPLHDIRALLAAAKEPR